MSDDDVPLLLHSLVEVWDQLESVLSAVDPSTIVEIGSESGGTTAQLVGWAASHEATVVSVDPEPAPALRALEREGAPLRLVAEPSPAGLAGVDGEVWIIDGDHNYATVRAELERAFAVGDPRLAILHDVGWPAGRRDQYYAPDRLAPESRQEHTYRGGVVPDVSDLAEVGFSGRGEFAWATHEGGPANGVRTAVEDFAGDHGGLRLDVIPCLFGVGFLYTEDAPWAEIVQATLAPYADARLLARLERNRLALYLRVLELQDALTAREGEHDRLVAALHEQIGVLEAQALARAAADLA